MSPSPRQQTPIAVVGVSALFPGSTDARGFWDDILAGRDLITEVPPSHWRVEDYYDPDPKAQDKTYSKRGGFLSQVDFDPLEFGVPPSNVPATDSAQILALIVAQKVLEDASQGQFSEMDRERISVILGVTSAQELLGTMTSRLQKPVWLKALRESGIPEDEAQAICGRIAESYTPWQESSFPGLLGNVVAGRIANRFDLRGTNAVTDAACASSLAAVSMAINELQLGQSDLVLTGGVDAMNDIFMFMCFSKTPALSPTGDCRPFSDNADGTLLGEGIAMLALKRLEDAERDGDRVYAVIRGVGTASDGRANSVYAPLPEGQARSLRRAYEVAGYGPDTVELVEAHGTGTKAGDAAEFAGLKLAFSGYREDAQWCALGSVKSQIGHTKAAAGAAGLFKAVMALHHKVLPPTIKVERPNHKLEIERSPFYVNTQARPWIRGSAHPRRASVSSFGFGGSNFHIALEEYVPSRPSGKRAWRLRTQPTELVLLSAAGPAELVKKCRALEGAATDLQHLARESQLSFDSKAPVRLSLVASTLAELSEKLGRAASAIELAPEKSFATPTGDHYAAGPADPGKVAFLFPGQGSQYVGMGADAAMACDEARRAWDAAADMDFGDRRLPEVVFPRPVFTDADREAQQKLLTATEWAQPALGIHSQSLSALLHALGIRPSCVAGHSFGEVTALFEAGVLTSGDLLRVARRRGELMRDACSLPGAMTAVAGSLEAVRAVLAASGAEVVVANHNSPTQVVLSGSTEEIIQVEAALAAERLTVRRLPVATAFHSPLVAGSSAPFRAFLEGVALAPPMIDVYGNASALPYPQDASAIRDQLAAQLGQPVRFVELIENMYSAGVRTFVEVGAGSVLTELVGRILGHRPHVAVNLDRKGRHGLTALQEGLGRLALAGVKMDFAPLWESYAPTSDKPPKKPAMTLPISGANLGQQFPSNGESKILPPPNPSRALPVSTTPAPDSAWSAAFQDMQRQTAETHAAYQRAMADSHVAFLKTVETSLAGMGALWGSADPRPLPLAIPAALPVPLPTPMPLPPAPKVEPVAAAAPALDLEALMMAIVAEKTGYPREMLGAHMELEADLGIDSIKRVEILSELRERAPGLPEVKAMDLVSLRTLGQIVAHMRTAGGKEVAVAASTPNPETPKLDLEALMMAIVAEKTGYPKDMLGVHMELEADLGIDSIKRVEILSELRERSPGLPEVKAMDLVSLRTLGQIIDHMRSAGGPAAPLPPAPLAVELPPANLHRHALREVPAVPVGLALPGILGAQRLVVTEDGGGIAAALVERLARLRIPAAVASTVPAEADAVVFLGGLRDTSTIEEATGINREAFHASRAVAARFTITGGTFVTVQDTGGDFGLSGRFPDRACLGGLSALARTAALEWPDAAVKAIDLERGSRGPGALAEAILNELLQGGSTLEVGLRADGRRTTLASVPVPQPPVRGEGIDGASVILASGGGRGVTAACLLALAKAKKPRLVLVGRTPLAEEPAATVGISNEADLRKALLQQALTQGDPSTPAAVNRKVSALLAVRELRANLAALREAGSEVRYLAVDIMDAEALTRALESVRREWGPITALVHGAGVLADKRIEEKTDAQFDHVFDTKVGGLRALLTATQDDPLKSLCLFSSVAARTGNPGQCDYAMANEVLNQVACAEHARRGASCAVRSIGWGPWEGGMVTPSLKAHFQNMGVALIPLGSGANCFVEELLGGGDTTVIIGAGEGGLGTQAPPKAALEVRVDRHSHAYLADHALHGGVVLPMVLALEWFMRAARACRPDLVVTAVTDLKVLRGIRLHGFSGEGDRFTVSGRQTGSADGARIALELRGSATVLHYSATVQMAERVATAPAAIQAPTLGMWDQPEVYEGHVLFHGPRFQVIESVEGLSREGIKGTLTGIRKTAWPAEPWLSDAAALDGGLQLVLLWSRHVLGGAVLPMALGEYRSYLEGPAEGSFQATVLARAVQESGTLSDLVFSDAEGRVVAELRGVETVIRPVSGNGAALGDSRHSLRGSEPVIRLSETISLA